MQEKELKNFIKENSPYIYKYTNTQILKDIGSISPNFFTRLLSEYFTKEEKRISTENLSADTLIYYLIAEVLGDARQAFPFFRKDTLTLEGVFSEAKVYFNHVKFTIEEGAFTIALIQTKAGVSTLEEELVKHSKSFAMKTTGLDEFIAKNSNKALDDEQAKLKEDIKDIL